MGSVSRFHVNRIAEDYVTPYFVETGTWKGDGVAYALQTPFTKIISVEIIADIAEQARQRFQTIPSVQIISGHSVPVLKEVLPALKGNCIFWLDAHFPGADEGVKQYDAEDDEQLRLPLESEIEVIKQTRAGYKDVLIIDDLRIYEDGPYENGNAPEDTLPKNLRSIDFLYRHFGKTHSIIKSYLDEGYILLFPEVSNRLQVPLSQYIK